MEWRAVTGFRSCDTFKTRGVRIKNTPLSISVRAEPPVGHYAEVPHRYILYLDITVQYK